MSENGKGRDTLRLAFVALGLAVLALGIALAFSGFGATLQQPRDVMLHVRALNLDKSVAEQVKVGDPIYTDPAGIQVGRVVRVSLSPEYDAVADSKGGLHKQADPLDWEVDVVVQARGREGNGLVALDTQVIQAGNVLNLISPRYYLPASVVSVDVK